MRIREREEQSWAYQNFLAEGAGRPSPYPEELSTSRLP